MLAPETINIFSQTQTKRVLVGKLWRQNKKFYFEYDKAYKKLGSAVPLGPELPLWKSKISSAVLFQPFLDRLPSKNNPAYKDYCREWGIGESENDVFVLLSTIGRRGPSTFIFERACKNEYTGSKLRDFRTRLMLTQAEFETLFGISHMTLVRLESSESQNEFYLRYFELLDKEPKALEWIVNQRGQYLHDEKRIKIGNLIRMLP